MKCCHCGSTKKPSQMLNEELAGLIVPCNSPQDANRVKWIIEKLGKVLDTMMEDKEELEP